MLLCALVQPAFSSALLASGVTLALHGRAHAHSVALVADDGHVDLVLSHTDRERHDRGSHDHGNDLVHDDTRLAHGESDHVLHVASDEATRVSSRKLSIDPAPAIVVAPAVEAEPELRPGYRAPEQPRFRGAQRIRTVVLQL
jgi:hypothetical protein